MSVELPVLPKDRAASASDTRGAPIVELKSADVPSKRFWIGVAGTENAETLRKHGFSFFAVGPRFQKVLARVSPGDELVIYQAGGGRASGFCVIATVVTPPYERHVRDFAGMRTLPHRIDIQPRVDAFSNPVHLSEVAERLRFIKNPKHPGMYLQTHLREIDATDFDAISKALEARVHESVASHGAR